MLLPIRGSSSSARAVPVSYGLHGRRGADYRAHACLLPHDEDLMRPPADARYKLLLSRGPIAERTVCCCKRQKR